MSQILEDLLRGTDLTEQQAEDLLHDLTGGEMDPAVAGAILAASEGQGRDTGGGPWICPGDARTGHRSPGGCHRRR